VEFRSEAAEVHAMEEQRAALQKAGLTASPSKQNQPAETPTDGAVYSSPIPQQMLELGWSIIPVGLDKRPLISWKEFQSRHPAPEEVKRWDQTLHPPCWAMVTGKISGRITLDFDGEAGAATMRRLGLVPHRRTYSGGYHVDFLYPGHRVPTMNGKSKKELAAKYPGMDVRGDGGYAVVIRQGYEWLRDPAGPLVAVPIDLSALDAGTKPNGGNHVLHYERQRVDAQRLIDMALDQLAFSGRNDAGFALALQLRDNGYSQNEALSIMQDYAARCPGTNTKGDDEAYTASEIRATLAQAYSRPAREPWGTGTTSVHHAEEAEKPEPPPASGEKSARDDHQIAEDLLTLEKRFLAVSEHELNVIVPWILHTHSVEVFYFSPLLQVTSAEKLSGKSTVLDVLNPLVRNPLQTESISPAALARVMEQGPCTLLIDEYDIQLNERVNKESAGLLRGILNGGFKKTGSYTRVVGVGANLHVKAFPTYGAKALAGIDPLPDTVASRSIPIQMKRAARGLVEPFRPDGMSQESKVLRDDLERLRVRAAKWAQRHAQQIGNREPLCPIALNSRQRDISEPLIAICEVLGGPWPERISKALSTIFASPVAEDNSKRVLLLGHIRKIFAAKFDNSENLDPAKMRIRTEELIQKLCAREDAPWSEWNGKNITPYQLSKLLRNFEIGPHTIRDPHPVKGYVLSDFLDAFNRYLPPICICEGCDCHEACNGGCNPSEDEVSPNDDAGCNGVTAKTGVRKKRG
jgi:hypothetical protein